MKRIISLLLALITVLSLCSTVVMAEEETISKITIQNAEGFASQAVNVTIRIDDTLGVSGATLKIKYDKRLELVYATDGNFFTNVAKSAIYKQDTSGVNGEYIFVALNNGEDSMRIRGEFVTLTFIIPSDAQIGDTYKVELDKKSSILATGIDSTLDYTLTNGKITVKEGTACTSHTFGDSVVVGTSSYLSNGYSYKQCTTCNVIESEYTPATEINAFEYLGTSVNFTGKPSGIAPMYNVNMNAINVVKGQNPGCKVEAGIEIYKDGKLYDEEIFFGEGATYSLVDNVLFVKITDISAYDEFTFKAYVSIANERTGEKRVAYNVATVRGSEEISICDVVKCLDLNKYSEENQAYLQNILDGFAD